MKRNDYLETANLIFGVIVSFLSLASAVVPIFSARALEYIFIDTKAILFTSISGLIILLFTGWFTTSLDFFLVLLDKQGKEINKMAQYRFLTILLLIVTIFGVYTSKLLFDTKLIHFSIATAIQILCYMLMYLFLGLHIGIAFQTTRQTEKNQRLNEEKIDRLINLLVKSGHTPIKVLSIAPFNPVNNEGVVTQSLNVAQVEIAGRRKQFTLTYDIDNILLTTDLIQEMETAKQDVKLNKQK